ncbi:hypothetical protein [Nocardia transvalensis]|uniref:hypothetical protein n=1 Tax=Nocardia transvalensis TaxID=37333 RepID=UPI001895B280|nr:hypothetical protein [Nocardia transvalensis]MBF6328740.1 hypothetical protein [Nocardia transvalensis]
MNEPVTTAPADPAPAAVTPPADPTAEPAAPQEDPATPSATRAPEDYEAEIAKLRREAAGWRTKFREAEPIVKAHNEAQEAQKTEIQRATDRATQLAKDLADRETELAVLRAAYKHGIGEEDIDLLGSGTPEELDTRAARLAAKGFGTKEKTPPPPSDRPLESLRPGASPTPPPAVDNTYPADWMPRARTTERS